MHDKGVITSSQQSMSYSADTNKKKSYPEASVVVPTATVIPNVVRNVIHKVDGITNGSSASRQMTHHTKGPNAQRSGRSFSSMVPQKRNVMKNPNEFIGKDGDFHYVDPPQEFFFKSTREAK